MASRFAGEATINNLNLLFQPGYSGDFGSALSYIPEIPWNNCAPVN
jgi:hypothetical protein